MSFDINCNGQFLCGGTEQIKKDAYLLLFDTRNTKLMSGYWESHTDDVSHVSISIKVMKYHNILLHIKFNF